MAAEPAGALRSPAAPRFLRILCGVVWWWALWRLATGHGGSIEASVAAGSWGLSLLPLHVTPARAARGTAARACAPTRPGAAEFHGERHGAE